MSLTTMLVNLPHPIFHSMMGLMEMNSTVQTYNSWWDFDMAKIRRRWGIPNRDKLWLRWPPLSKEKPLNILKVGCNSDDPIYDSYESESREDYKEDDAQPIQIAKELSPLPKIDDKKNSDEPTFEMYKYEVQGYSAEEEVCEKIEEQYLDQSIVLSKESMHQPILELKVVLSKTFCQFVDPIADYMESIFLIVSLIISHGVFLAYGYKYGSHLQSMLHAF